jgi:hypothetical protein
MGQLIGRIRGRDEAPDERSVGLEAPS